ncbi:Capsular polysaccharide biosynthesis protein [Friedmanniella luteola]|uniref:Capsular polysaccharide biosynthesis protein n=1 Tax=Friedmanniella luteola TaxID=546871 RepID=A0A1H1Q0D1_9ACTN|nr:Wzz/FepE/Etk N-terminal domain-containing protein [Friedmanniella luteola]SDS16793.1 Capsular polysaccharide biosynthesis protein [Friedmanniella luteola]
MTTTGFIHLIRRHVALVLACTLGGAALATLLATFVVTPSYVATTQLYVSARGSNANDRLQNGEYARTHVSSYTDMVDSSDLLQAVRTELGLAPSRNGDYSDLADSIEASNTVDTAVITVRVEDSSAEGALRVATAIGEVYDAVVARMENASPEQSPVRVNVLSAADLPRAPYSPSRRLYAAIGLVLGLAVGAGVAWARENRPGRTRRPTRADRSQPGSWSWDVDGPVRRPAGAGSNGVPARPTGAEVASNGSGLVTKEGRGREPRRPDAGR